MFHRGSPILLYETFWHCVEESGQSVKDFNQAARANSNLLTHPTHGNALQIMHGGRISNELAAVKTL